MRTYKELFLQPKFETIPSELQSLPWAVWIAEPRKNKPGKFNKAPRSPKTGDKIGTNKPRWSVGDVRQRLKGAE